MQENVLIFFLLSILTFSCFGDLFPVGLGETWFTSLPEGIVRNIVLDVGSLYLQVSFFPLQPVLSWYTESKGS